MQSPSATSAALGGLIALAAAIGIGRFVYTPILPPMIAALGFSRATAGLIASANFIGYLTGALLAASPRLPGSRRAWLLGSLAVSALTTAGMGGVHSLLPFLALRFAGGLASAVVLVLASAVVLQTLAETHRPGLSALHFAGVGAGIAISAALVAGLLSAGQDWRVLWLASGALSLLALIPVAALLRDPTLPTRAAGQVTDRPGNGGLVRVIAAYGLFGFGYVITATFIVAIVRGTPAIQPLETRIFIVFGLAAAPSVALWTRIARRFGVPATFAVACVVEALGVLTSVAWPGPFGILLAAVLVGGTFMGLTALGLVQARALASGDPRRALALMTSAFGLGQIVGPSFAGMISDRLGGFGVPSAAAALALLVAAFLALTQPPRPHPACAAAAADPPTPPCDPSAPASARPG